LYGVSDVFFSVAKGSTGASCIIASEAIVELERNYVYRRKRIAVVIISIGACDDRK
jgi:hypothetical protein